MEVHSDNVGRVTQCRGSHPGHGAEQLAGELALAEDVVVEEVEMATGQGVDLGQGVVDLLGVEASSAGEERVLVAEVAGVGAAPGHDE